MLRLICVLSLLGASSGCGGSNEVHAEHAKALKPAPEAPADTSAQPAPVAEPADGVAAAPSAGSASGPAAQGPAPAAATPLADDVDGGEISRATVIAVLSQGIGRFLQRVRTEPVLSAGRFSGWRILSFPAGGAPGLHSGALLEGDTVLRVNGHSIERPEQFKNVWDSMATESQVVLLVQRAGKQGQVRYRIVD